MGTGSGTIEGVYAAVLTPRTEAGELDEAALRGLLEFLLAKGVRGFAINGATGEFCLTTEQEFSRLVAVTAEATRGRASFLAGIGAASAAGAIRLGRAAAEGGADGLLLPMPYFFPYTQQDLKGFVRAVAAETSAGVLLYNLPQFTSGLNAETSVELIGTCPGVVGIKDSSGSLETVRRLTAAGMAARRMIGNDEVLARALEEKVLDGVVSGVACVLPELIGGLYAAEVGGAEFRELSAALSEFIAQIRAFPTPWALKMIAEARGLMTARFPMPLSAEREEQRASLLRWFADNRARVLAQ